MSKLVAILLAVGLLIGGSVITGFTVHHNDADSANRALMMSQAMQKKAVAQAAETAAMQQKEKDKMATQDTMMPTDSGSSMAN
jgi:hypothetical protein